MHKLKRLVKKLLHKIHNFNYPSHYPAGHFYSPVTNIKYIQKNQDSIFDINKKITAINLNTENQLLLFEKLLQYYPEQPFTEEKSSNLRYYFDNVHFCHFDALALYAMIRYLKPKRIIEAGSGFSSAVMLDTNSKFMENAIKFTFIEPYPHRLYSLLSEQDKEQNTIVVKPIQDTDLQIFTTLEENDILFIDSTHVSKTGSDVNHVIFEILPILKSGVIVHFHDIFYPFEYPKHWVLNKGFGWNEDYLLRAFLMYNNEFEIIFFNTYLAYMHPDLVQTKMQLAMKNTGGSIYLRKK